MCVQYDCEIELYQESLIDKFLHAVADRGKNVESFDFVPSQRYKSDELAKKEGEESSSLIYQLSEEFYNDARMFQMYEIPERCKGFAVKLQLQEESKRLLFAFLKKRPPGADGDPKWQFWCGIRLSSIELIQEAYEILNIGKGILGSRFHAWLQDYGECDSSTGLTDKELEVWKERLRRIPFEDLR